MSDPFRLPCSRVPPDFLEQSKAQRSSRLKNRTLRSVARHRSDRLIQVAVTVTEIFVGVSQYLFLCFLTLGVCVAVRVKEACTSCPLNLQEKYLQDRVYFSAFIEDLTADQEMHRALKTAQEKVTFHANSDTPHRSIGAVLLVRALVAPNTSPPSVECSSS